MATAASRTPCCSASSWCRNCATIARQCDSKKQKDGRTGLRKTILLMALMVLIGGADAFAQGSSSVSKNSGGGGGGVLPAPIGHRQPRASDVPSEKNLSDPNDPLSKENRALDRKIKSICRGC